MKLWVFILCMVIAAVLAIWGCTVVIDTTEQDQVTTEFSCDDYMSQNNISKQSKVTAGCSLTSKLMFQSTNRLTVL